MALDNRPTSDYPSTDLPHTAPEKPILKGTVAIRIAHLQKLTDVSALSNISRPLARRDHKRAGYFGRTSTQSGFSASATPKELQVEIGYSLPGLYASHANSTKERTPANAKFKWERTAGLHGQLTPRGFEGRSQYEVTSPWGILPRSKGNAYNIADNSNHEIDMLNLSNSALKPDSQTPISEQPTSPANNEESATKKEQPTAQTAEADKPVLSCKKGTEPSEECIFTGTTAATHGRSLKELFGQYGVERPAGVLSSENVTYDANGTPRDLIASIDCHICAWTNGPHTACLRCGHLLCQQCDFQEMEKCNERTAYTECIPRLELPNSQQEVPKRDPPGVLKQDDQERNLIRQSPQQEFQDQETPALRNLRQARECSSRSGNSSFLSPRGPEPYYGARNGSSNYAELSDYPRTLTQPITEPMVPGTTQNPYPVPTQMLSASHLKLLPVAMQVNSRHSRHHGHRNRYEQRNLHDNSHTRSSSGAKPDECASSGCRATHAGHQPYRHSISCLQKRQACIYEANSGKLAGISHLDKFCGESFKMRGYFDNKPNTANRNYNRRAVPLKQSKMKPTQPPQSMNSTREKYGHTHYCEGAQPVSSLGSYDHPHEGNNREHAPHCSACNCSEGNSDISLEDGKDIGVSPMETTSVPSNYTECHGYPRTSHTPSRSPIAAGVVGECQHCLTDCQCTACQSTYHSVRCCVHKDHHPLTHHHYMPQKGPVVPVVLALKPASISKEPSHQPVLDSIQHERSTVVAPMPRRRMTSPQWMGSARDKSEERQIASLEPQDIPTEPEKEFTLESAVTKLPPIGKVDPSSAACKNSNCELDSRTTRGTGLAVSRKKCYSHAPRSLIAHSDYLSGEKATVSPSRQSFISPHSKHDPGNETRRLSELFKQGGSAELLLGNKVQGHQQRLESFEDASDGIRMVISDEISHRMDIISEPGQTGNIEPEERISTPACEHNGSGQRKDHKFKSTNYFMAERGSRVEGVSDEKIPPLHPPLDVATKASEARHIAKPLQEKNRSETIDQSDDIVLQRRSSPKVISEEESEFLGARIQAVIVTICLKGEKDLVLKTDLGMG